MPGEDRKPSMLDLPPSYVQETGAHQSRSTEAEPPDQTPELTLDGQLILPTIPPAQALYQISRELNLRGTSMSLFRCSHKGNISCLSYSQDSHTADQLLYEMTNVPLQRTIEISGKRRSTYPRSIVMKLGLFAGFKINSIHKGQRSYYT
jgi:hypothetical protein